MYSKLAAVLTPMSKAYCTEMANQVAYDGLQIHGGTGYMRDFNAERFYRDARITNIYEGTTQLQIVAAIGGVVQRVLEPTYDELAALPYEGVLERLAAKLAGMRGKLGKTVDLVNGRKDPEYQNLMARALVEMETYVLVGYLMIRDAMRDKSREPLAEKYVLDAESDFESRYLLATSGDTTVIDKHSEIIDY
jgi:alkylation response protein AidB-like acyl-CoA dehydrogenase